MDKGFMHRNKGTYFWWAYLITPQIDYTFLEIPGAQDSSILNFIVHAELNELSGEATFLNL